jgi:broad specificity phosphatase PhoE
MRILLVRHGRAGSKAEWIENDRLRPLTRRGVAQAEALVPLLVPFQPRRILSSPLVRGVQTIEPLAAALGLVIERDESLGPTADGLAESLVRTIGGSSVGPVVVSTHRTVIRRLQWRLGRRSGTPFSKGAPCPKGSTWVLEWTNGELCDATYLPPPALEGRLEESA